MDQSQKPFLFHPFLLFLSLLLFAVFDLLLFSCFLSLPAFLELVLELL
tara:strand:+ start:10446 stop:10589 length:144 start_codon:yes stop_codon:yes gene_type:complete